jgi:hypothetical protein
VKDVTRAMDTAEREFKVPKLMLPEGIFYCNYCAPYANQDMVEYPDDLSIMTYISYFQQKEREIILRTYNATFALALTPCVRSRD